MRVLLGTPPAPPTVVSAETIRALRSAGGSPPCSEGLAAALEWIGDRELPIEQALAEAREEIDEDFVEWAEDAAGISGYGYGSGYGDGDGDGDGYGYGYGYGYGDGYGYGYGYGDGYGYGYGDGDGDGSGSGYGYGDGDGSGYGYGGRS